VLLVGNHQAFGLDLSLLVAEFLTEKNELPRGLAHPAAFSDPRRSDPNIGGAQVEEPELIEATAGPLSPGPLLRWALKVARGAVPPAVRGVRKITSGGIGGGGGGGGGLPGGNLPGVPDFASFGAVPVTPRNFYRLLAAGELILLFPGGAREAFHGKGEANTLFWPSSAPSASTRPREFGNKTTSKPTRTRSGSSTDFVRMAAAFDAVIVPFGAVGAADSLAIVADPADLERLAEWTAPVLRSFGKQQSRVPPRAARDWAAGRDQKKTAGGETTDMRPPLVVPKPTGPDRLYFLFGKPVDTRGLDPRDRGQTARAHAEVKRRVEGAIAFLLASRRRDPFRSMALRLPFELLNDRAAPSFSLRHGEKGCA
jgi:hypothetical protein